jgi:hypothetical protein
VSGFNSHNTPDFIIISFFRVSKAVSSFFASPQDSKKAQIKIDDIFILTN